MYEKDKYICFKQRTRMRGRNEWSETICGSLKNQPKILGEAFGRSRRPCALSAFGAYAARFHSCHVLFDCVNWCWRPRGRAQNVNVKNQELTEEVENEEEEEEEIFKECQWESGII